MLREYHHPGELLGLQGVALTARFHNFLADAAYQTHLSDPTARTRSCIDNLSSLKRRSQRGRYRMSLLAKKTDFESKHAALKQARIKACSWVGTQHPNALVQAIIKVAPTSQLFAVEISLRSRGIGLVKKGQPDEVKIDFFPFARYGVIHDLVKSHLSDENYKFHWVWYE